MMAAVGATISARTKIGRSALLREPLPKKLRLKSKSNMIRHPMMGSCERLYPLIN